MAPIGHRRDGNGASSRGEAAVERARRELVPGELIRLVAGDRVPADTQLREARDLHVQQAALTGESAPVEKEAGGPAQSGLDARDRVYLGTSVVAGVATAVVLATGPHTAFGDIAARLGERPPPTEFERGLDQFAHLILRTVVLLVLVVRARRPAQSVERGLDTHG